MKSLQKIYNQVDNFIRIEPFKTVPAEPQDIIQFIQDAVNNRIEWMSQEPEESQICLNCKNQKKSW